MGERYYIFQDDRMIGSAATLEQATLLIRQYQAEELKVHQWLHSEFSYIKGTEVFVPYEKKRS